MPWLLRDGRVLAAIEVAPSRRARRRGLLGRDSLDGALLLRPARSVHTLGMRFDIDVAYCADVPAQDVATPVDDGKEPFTCLVVLETVVMGRRRIGRPRWRASCVVEAQAGGFERWGVRAGDRLDVQ
jgi:uncharacterized membrane protein (UPF0127 family)